MNSAKKMFLRAVNIHEDSNQTIESESNSDESSLSTRNEAYNTSDTSSTREESEDTNSYESHKGKYNSKRGSIKMSQSKKKRKEKQ